MRFYVASLISSIKTLPRQRSLAVIYVFLSPARLHVVESKQTFFVRLAFLILSYGVFSSQQCIEWQSEAEAEAGEKGHRHIHQSRPSSVPDWPSVWQLAEKCRCLQHFPWQERSVHLPVEPVNRNLWEAYADCVNSVCFVLVLHVLKMI